jgi:hypothetical protein
MKRIKFYFVFALYFSLVVYSGYLYSLRWDFLHPGANLRDGLFFLAFYIIILPLLIVTSILKIYFFKPILNNYLKFSFVLYSLLITLPAIDTTGSQTSLAMGTIFCLLTSLCILVEAYIIHTKYLTRS